MMMMKSVVLVSLVASASAFAGDPKPPGPPAELTGMAKSLAGTWKCTGKAELGGVTGDIKGTLTHKADLDGFWISSSLTATAGKATFHATMMMTFDAGSKRFYRMSATSHGGHGTEWGTVEGTKTSWEGEDYFGGNNHRVRGTDELVSPKEAHITGEYSDDGGKTWKIDHDVTCKK